MPARPDETEISVEELREVAGYAAACANRALPIFNEKCLETRAQREAIASAFAFAAGGKRTNALRISVLAAYRAARETSSPAAVDAAHAASQAAAAAFLHPLARAHQVKHVLGAAAPGPRGSARGPWLRA